MVINIRELQSQDQLQWLGLWEGYTCFYGSPQPDDVTQYTWQRLLDGASPVIGRAAVVDSRVVGFAICVLHEGTWVKTPVCYLEDLFVDPAMRGRGVARALVQALHAEGKRKGGRASTGIRVLIIPPVSCMMSSPRRMSMSAIG